MLEISAMNSALHAGAIEFGPLGLAYIFLVIAPASAIYTAGLTYVALPLLAILVYLSLARPLWWGACAAVLISLLTLTLAQQDSLSVFGSFVLLAELLVVWGICRWIRRRFAGAQ